MKKKNNKSNELASNKAKELVKARDAELLSLVAEKLKGRVLFPEKIEKAKKQLEKIKSTNNKDLF